MLENESILIRTVRAALPPSRVAILGSSTEDYYKNLQPYIWINLYEPFEGLHQFVNFDIREGPGIDIVIGALSEYGKFDGEFDFCLACSVLEHVEQPQELLDAIDNMVKPGGSYLFSGPGEWPYHEDPIDNMLRFDSAAKWRMVLPPQYDIKSFFKLNPCGPGYVTAVVCRRIRKHSS